MREYGFVCRPLMWKTLPSTLISCRLFFVHFIMLALQTRLSWVYDIVLLTIFQRFTSSSRGRRWWPFSVPLLLSFYKVWHVLWWFYHVVLKWKSLPSNGIVTSSIFFNSKYLLNNAFSRVSFSTFHVARLCNGLAWESPLRFGLFQRRPFVCVCHWHLGRWSFTISARPCCRPLQSLGVWL